MYPGPIFPQMSNSHRRINEEATSDFAPFLFHIYIYFFFSWGKFLTSFCRHQSLTQSLTPYPWTVLPRTWSAALMSLALKEFEVRLCRAPLINSALFPHTRETTVHVQVLNKQRRHPSSDGENGCSEWVAKRFSHSPFTSFFSLGTIMSG